MDRSIIEKKILDTFKRNPEKWYKHRAIMKAARISERDYRTLKVLLLEMFKNGLVDQKGRNQYAYKPKLEQKTGVLVYWQ